MPRTERVKKRSNSSLTMSSPRERKLRRSGTAFAARQILSPARAFSARRKFLRAFPGGFRDETYVDWERAYKWKAHVDWQTQLDVKTFRHLLKAVASPT